MSTTSDGPPREGKEGRRLRALALSKQGWKAIRIAAALGVTRGAVSQWLQAARDGGPAPRDGGGAAARRRR